MTFSRLLFCLIASVAAASFWQCGGKDGAGSDGAVVLAAVYNKTLYSTDLKDVVPEGASADDSLLIARAFVQRWVRDQLLMYEAERNIPKDLNIDELVRDYRASLVRFNFEEQIIAAQLDSTVSEAELRAYYENNKDQFQLGSTIVKCQLLKAPSGAPQNELNKLWYSRSPADEAKLRAAADRWAVQALLDREKWYKVEDLAAILPKGTLTAENVAPRREGVLSDEDFRYYYRILEVVRGKETAPFEYAREQASKIILHRRKQGLLDKWKDDLYQKELRRENVKVY